MSGDFPFLELRIWNLSVCSMLLLAASLSFFIEHFRAVTGESLYTVIRNIQERSVRDLLPYASQGKWSNPSFGASHAMPRVNFQLFVL